MKISAIILAAGSSARFGRNKLLAPFPDLPVIELVIATACRYPFAGVAVVSRYPEIRALALCRNALYVENEEAAQGQSTSIRRGILALPPCDGYLFWPGDQPLVSLETLEALCLAFEKMPESIVTPLYGRTPGSPRIFPARCRDALLALEGDMGGRRVAARDRQVIHVPVENKREGLDIDTWKDLETGLEYREDM